jgi:SAM-dependent methyltransferase
MMFATLPSLQAATERVKRLLFDTEDRWFEWRYGLELATPVAHDDLVAGNALSLAHATSYQGVWCRNVRALWREARRCRPGLDSFVDIGSGKGKACFYAAMQPGPRHVVGLEFSAPLVAAARRNQQRLASLPIEFIHADATEWLLPERTQLVFLFNPFDALILDRFLTNNRSHFQGRGSLLGYANDVHHTVLREHGFDTVYRDPVRRLSLFSLGEAG